MTDEKNQEPIETTLPEYKEVVVKDVRQWINEDSLDSYHYRTCVELTYFSEGKWEPYLDAEINWCGQSISFYGQDSVKKLYNILGEMLEAENEAEKIAEERNAQKEPTEVSE